MGNVKARGPVKISRSQIAPNGSPPRVHRNYRQMLLATVTQAVLGFVSSASDDARVHVIYTTTSRKVFGGVEVTVDAIVKEEIK